MIFRVQAIGRGGKQPDERRFERTVLQHVDAAYNLARWMTGNDQDAEDIVQEASVRAFRYFEGFRGGDCRAWFLTIVRNTGQSWLRRNRAHEITGCLDDERDARPADAATADPETILLGRVDTATLYAALGSLPLEYREVLVLRELEELSYKEIADVVGVPIGTVMSRLARARKRLQQTLTAAVSGVSA